MTFASFDAMFNGLTIVSNAHFFDWFDGNTLSPIWTKTVHGVDTSAMVDGIDNAYQLITNATSNSDVRLDFNNKRNFNNASSVLIAVFSQITNSANNLGACGLSNVQTQLTVGNTTNSAFIQLFGANNLNFTLQTSDALTQTGTSMGLAFNQSFHILRTILGSSNVVGTVDGVNTTTKTTNLPTVKLQPFVYAGTTGSSAITDAIRYLEAYNV